jgi:hypothetical protein
MKSVVSVSFVGCFLFLSACATQPRVATTPVRLTVTSKTESKRFVNHLRDATLTIIGKQVPNAQPMTVTAAVEVESDLVSADFNPLWGSLGGGQHAVPAVSADPYSDGSRPMVGSNAGSSVPFPQPLESINEVQVSYTIAGADGRVLESNQVKYAGNSIDGSDPFGDRYRRRLVAETAGFLASRVAALSH